MTQSLNHRINCQCRQTRSGVLHHGHRGIDGAIPIDQGKQQLKRELTTSWAGSSCLKSIGRKGLYRCEPSPE
jgi:hypothetical protein